jgi:hypothetical protein
MDPTLREHLLDIAAAKSFKREDIILVDQTGSP